MPRKSPHPHVAWRDGRPRFSPGPDLRAAGHAGKDLRHDDGRWYSRGECVDWSDVFVKQLKKAATAARASRAPTGGQLPAGSGAAVRSGRKEQSIYTVERLFEDWFRTGAKFQLPADPHELQRLRAAGVVYAPKTVRDYHQKARVIETHDPAIWQAPVDALSQPVLVQLYDELVATRGLATARGALVVLSAALGWGKRRGKFTYRANSGVNPALNLAMSMPPPRVRFGSRAEISALIAAADRAGWPEMGDMVILGVWTGQRQGDRLLMVDKGSLNGRRIFRQAKTGAIVSIREAPELEARMRASAERRRVAGVVNRRVILDEQVWQPFPDDGDRYRKRFAELRAIAARHCPTLLGDPEEGILPFFEMDLRDTAVTWLALAGATIPEIVSITGHTLESATMILKHYLARHPEMADSAIRKMVEWYEADGETEFGL